MAAGYELNTKANSGASGSQIGATDSSGWVVNFGSGSVGTGGSATSSQLVLVAAAIAVVWLLTHKH